MSQPRNVLFLIADDWSPIAGCYGNPVIRTPHIDALARRGTVFDGGFCTSPSCAVSRASLLTGHYSHTHGQYGHCHGIHGFRTHEHMHSTPVILRDQGYATALIGKNHVAPASVYPFEVQTRMNPAQVADLADAAGQFLHDHPRQPFYLHVAFICPHRMGSGFGNEQTYRGVDAVRYQPEEVVVPPFLPDIPATRLELADYYQAVSRFDAGVGMVLEMLEKSGRAQDTLIFVTSDHGMPFPGAKASGFDSGHHCPLIVSSPQQSRRGQRSQALVNWCDIHPTILDWCGAAQPPPAPFSCPLPSRSFLSVLDQDYPAGWDETFFSHCFHEVTNYYPYRVLRGRRYKYVRNLAHHLPTPLPSDLYRSRTWSAVREGNLAMMGQRPTEVFLHQEAERLIDLEDDPVEARNRVRDPALSGVLNQMRRKLMDFRIRTLDPWLEQSFQEGEPGAPDLC